MVESLVLESFECVVTRIQSLSFQITSIESDPMVVRLSNGDVPLAVTTFLYVESGSIVVEIGSSVHIVDAGHALVYRASSPVRVIARGRLNAIRVCFSADLAASWLIRVIEPSAILRAWMVYLRTFLTEAHSLRNADEGLIRQGIDLIRSQLVPFQEPSPTPEARLVAEALQMMKENHWNVELSIADIASATHTSARSLQRAFAMQNEGTPMGSLRGIRANVAYQAMIDHPKAKRARIARLAGFGSTKSMLRAVTSIYGHVPSPYPGGAGD